MKPATKRAALSLTLPAAAFASVTLAVSLLAPAPGGTSAQAASGSEAAAVVFEDGQGRTQVVRPAAGAATVTAPAAAGDERLFVGWSDGAGSVYAAGDEVEAAAGARLRATYVETATLTIEPQPPYGAEVGDAVTAELACGEVAPLEVVSEHGAWSAPEWACLIGWDSEPGLSGAPEWGAGDAVRLRGDMTLWARWA